MTNENPISSFRPRWFAWGLAALLLLGLVLRLTLAAKPPAELVPICLADDAFYYLRIAEHIIAGDGPSFDGRTATNGYHPLWMGVSLLAVKAAGGAVAGARILLLLLALIGTANAYLFGRIARLTCGDIAGLVAAGFWALNPLVVYTELMGVEAPLMVLLVFAATLVYLPLRASDDAPPARWLMLGALVGLALMARTDAILYCLPLALDITLARWWVARGEARRLRRRVTEALTAAGAALAVTLPWIVYNLLAFGSVAQDSMRVLLLRQRAFQAATGEELGPFLAGQLKSGFGDYFLRYVGLGNVYFVFGLLGLVSGMLLAARLVAGKPLWTAKARGLLHLLAWGAVGWLFYSLYFWDRKNWYFFPVMAALGLFFALAAGYLERVVPVRRTGAALLALAGVLLLTGYSVQTKSLAKNGYHPWQVTYLAAAQAVRELNEAHPGVRIGAMNSGVISAFSGVDVVNLDGVVNPNLRRAMERKDLTAYLRREQIGYVVDHLDLIAGYDIFAGDNWRRSFKLERRFKTKRFAGDVVILKFEPPEDAP